MRDSFNRQIDYLRIALTSRCNLRCIYCMPPAGLPATPATQLLSAEELERVGRAAVAVGFRKIRLTGGEPTLRPDLLEIVSRLASISAVQEFVMTTNGARLAGMAQALARAGLQRVNIHLDSLSLKDVSSTMGLHSLKNTWQAITASEQAGLLPIKINAVIVRGYNDHSVPDLAQLTLHHDWHVRFIELIPIGEPAKLALSSYVSTSEMQELIQRELGALLPINGGELDGEARLYRLPGAQGTLGFISPVSNPYCTSCSRMRLTVDGRLRPCLLADQEFDLLSILRNGGSQSELEVAFRKAIREKPAGGLLQQGVFPESRLMAHVGG